MRTHVALVAVLLGLAHTSAANTGYQDSGMRTPSTPGQFGAARDAQDVLVIRDFLPWGGDVVPAFLAHGANVTVITTAMIPTVDLNEYCAVFVTGGTTEPMSMTSIRLNNAIGLFTAYLSGGGHMLYETGTWGAILQLPGGAWTQPSEAELNTFTAACALSVGMPFPDFDGSLASHDRLLGLPQDADVLITNPAGAATAAEYMVGNGTILVMAQPLECYIPFGGCDGTFPHMVTLLDNAIDYTLAAGNCAGIVVSADEAPLEFALLSNYPNPFNPVTTISFTMPETSQARLSVFNLHGNSVATLVDGLLERGRHQVSFNACGLGSGLYLYRLETAGMVQSGRMLLMK